MTKQSSESRPKPWLETDRLLGAYERMNLVLTRRLAELGGESHVEAALVDIIDPASMRIANGYARWRLVEFCNNVRTVLDNAVGCRRGGAGRPPEKAAEP